MTSISRFLVFGSQLLVSRAVVCPSPFTETLGVCLHFPDFTKSWCDAQAYCSSVNGELVRGSSFMPLNGATFPGMPPDYWIGLTDLLTERYTNKNGWRWTDGSLDPPSSLLAWRNLQPSAPHEDCIRQCTNAGKLCDNICSYDFIPMCQPRPQPSSSSRVGNFLSVPIPVGLTTNEYAQKADCLKRLTKVQSAIECASLCRKEWCAAFYFNEASEECRLVMYTDATIKMTTVRGWKKFVLI